MKTNLCAGRMGLNKANFLQSILLIFCSVLLTACSGKKTETIVIRGSNTVGEELAPRLIAEYAKEHPGVAFNTEFKGTTYGFGALMTRNCDIAAASREVTTNESALGKDNGVELKDYVIGAYSVAVIVNAGSPIKDLSTNRVRDIFTGVIRNWKELSGPDAPIHLYIRNPVSGTYLGFQEVAMEKKPYAGNVKALTSHAEIAQAIAKDPQGIGYSSMDVAKNSGVKVVSIAGVAPTVGSVNKGEYPYARVLRLYTDKSRESSAATDFIRFVQSTQGQKILEEIGFVPRP